MDLTKIPRTVKIHSLLFTHTHTLTDAEIHGNTQKILVNMLKNQGTTREKKWRAVVLIWQKTMVLISSKMILMKEVE